MHVPGWWEEAGVPGENYTKAGTRSPNMEVFQRFYSSQVGLQGLKFPVDLILIISDLNHTHSLSKLHLDGPSDHVFQLMLSISRLISPKFKANFKDHLAVYLVQLCHRL